MKFDILLESGLLLQNCTVYSNFGEALSMRHFENALYKERQVTVYNNNTRGEIIKRDDIYHVEPVKEFENE